VPGPYQIQAAISACHSDAATPEETDWNQIVALYLSLSRHIDSPIVELNRAVAVAKATGAGTGLGMIDQISGLEDYVYFHSARGALLAESGDSDAALLAYEKALSVATGDQQRRFLHQRMSQLQR
jgi:RNA polymerase sigma-70 factor (ECF subfamily)